VNPVEGPEQKGTFRREGTFKTIRIGEKSISGTFLHEKAGVVGRVEGRR